MENSKLISLTKGISDSLILDVENKIAYIQDSNISIRFPLNAEGEMNQRFLVLSRSELLHMAKFEKEIEVKPNFSYTGKLLHGKLTIPSDETDYSYLPEMFSSDEETKCFDISIADLDLIKNASVFTNPVDQKLTCQCVNIHESITSANSFGRTYYSANNLEGVSILLSQVAIKALLLLGQGTTVCDYSSSILMTKDKVAISLQKIDSAFLPISESLIPRINEIFDSNKIALNRSEFLDACMAMSLYAKKNQNNRIHLSVSEGVLTLTVDETNVNLNILPDSKIDSETMIDFDFNLEFLTQAISTVFKSETEVLYLYEKNDYKIYCLSPKDGEVISLGKLVS